MKALTGLFLAVVYAAWAPTCAAELYCYVCGGIDTYEKGCADPFDVYQWNYFKKCKSDDGVCGKTIAMTNKSIKVVWRNCGNYLEIHRIISKEIEKNNATLLEKHICLIDQCNGAQAWLPTARLIAAALLPALWQPPGGCS